MTTLALLRKNFNLQSIFFRRALRTGIAVFISVFIYRYFSLTQGFWVTLTTVIVMQATTAATLRKGLQRLIGTFIGIILGSLFLVKIQASYWIDCLLVFFFFLAYYLKSFNLVNYGVFVVPLTVAVVFLVSALVPQESHTLITARLYDTLIGAVIGILFTFFVFPNSLKQDVTHNLQSLINTQRLYFISILDVLLHQKESTETQKLRQQFEHCLTASRNYFFDWRYELLFKLDVKHHYKRLLSSSEKIGQFLFALHHLATSTPTLLENEYQSLQLIINQAKTDSSLQELSQEIQTQIAVLEQTDFNKNYFLTALIINLNGYSQYLIELQSSDSL